ncbi:MAG: hypothetical protein PVG83_13605 [Acidimicrobiia bacterium]
MTSRLVGISLIAGVVQAESSGMFRWDDVFFGRREATVRRPTTPDMARRNHDRPPRDGK